MTTQIALLRAVNLGSHNKVGMADLCALLSKLGFDQPRSLLQSGNLVFGSATKPAQLEVQLAAAAAKQLGLNTDFFVRSAREWQAIIAGNPFADAAANDPSHLVVMCCKKAPAKQAAAALQAAITGRETFAVQGRHAYFVYPDGIGQSKVTNVLIEKHLGTRVTGRNWNTVLKLAALAAA
jgi:uncharacterized protein (DUF1697 family)